MAYFPLSYITAHIPYTDCSRTHQLNAMSCIYALAYVRMGRCLAGSAH